MGFMFIFNPSNFSSFNFLYILLVFSLGYFVFHRDDFIYLIKNKRFFALNSLCIYLIGYLLVLFVSTGDSALYRAYTTFLVMMAVVSAVVIVHIFIKNNGINFIDFLRFIINIGVFQLFFVVLAILFPEFREWTLVTSRMDGIEELSNDQFGGLRSFGLASNYTSSLPMFMGLCSFISFYFFLYFNKLSLKLFYFLLTFLFLFSVILNARIGLVPIALLVFFLPLILLHMFRSHFKTVFFILILLVFLGGASYSVLLDSLYMERLNNGVEDFNNFLNGNLTGNFYVLKYMWFFPETTTAVLLGEGFDVFLSKSNNSDIGLIRDIYMYGLINAFVVGSIFLYFCKPLYKVLFEKFGLIFILIFTGSFFVYYFKGLIFASNEVVNLILLLVAFCVIGERKSLFYSKVVE